MKVLLIHVVIHLILSFIHSVSNNSATTDYFVLEKQIYSTPHVAFTDIKSSVECAMRCSINTDCCGYSQDSSSCFLFHYQTSNKCQNDTNGSVELHYVKQLTDCSELPPDEHSGVYRVYPSRQTAVLVYCEMTDAGGGWTVLQRRQDGSEDFYRYWADYKTGFGDLEDEFWIGNDIIHGITSQMKYKVRFDLEDFSGLTAYAEYDNFVVDDEAMDYGMNISGYSGTAGTGHGFDYAKTGIVAFSTRDVDNDQASDSCAVDRKRSGWWHAHCTNGNINGLYRPGQKTDRTMHWTPWRNYQSLHKTRMMIKPG